MSLANKHERNPMDYDAEDRRESREEGLPPGQDAGATPQFQLLLRATDGDHIMAASDTVNDLVEQAKFWLNAGDAGNALTDAMVRSIILQELDPATGAYVDSTELPVESKADVIKQARAIGAR